MLLRTLALLGTPRARRVERLLAAAPVRFVPSRGPAATALERGSVDLLMLDQRRLNTATSRVSARLGEAGQAPDVIVFAETEEPVQRAQLLGSGVLAVLSCTLDDAALTEALLALIQRCRAVAMHRLRGAPPASLSDFVSHSDDMKRLLLVARRMVDSDATLLLMGETGVGKERLARAIHDEGPRRGGPFVAINCGALPEALLESELFGHEEGAFTGAVRAHRGLFELAHTGSLFLDEIGEMPLLLQVKLLRVLQDRSIRPVGGERDLAVDVRVIAATNRDLHAAMQAGDFRADLYYRLAVVALTIPPLRERRADVPALVQNHLESLCVRLNRRPIAVSVAAMAALCAHEWPGNVRELANVLERAVLLGNGSEIMVGDLSGIVPPPPARVHQPVADELMKLPFALAEARVTEEFERAYLSAALRECGGRLGAVARRAGLSARTLYAKLQRLGLQKEQFRDGAGTTDGGEVVGAVTGRDSAAP